MDKPSLKRFESSFPPRARYEEEIKETLSSQAASVESQTEQHMNGQDNSSWILMEKDLLKEDTTGANDTRSEDTCPEDHFNNVLLSPSLSVKRNKYGDIEYEQLDTDARRKLS